LVSQATAGLRTAATQHSPTPGLNDFFRGDRAC
jgi:hypothetical protein